MLTGIVLGFLMGLLIIIIGLFIAMVCFDDELVVAISIILCIVSIIVGGLIGINVHKKQYDMKIRQWNNSKTTIEESLQDDNLTGLERLSIVTTITEYNIQLEELKTSVTYWWNWYLDDSLVEDLETIKLKGE